MDKTIWLNLAVALGIGLLIGTERERSNAATQRGERGDSQKVIRFAESVAGIRTLALVSVLGAVTYLVNIWLLVTSILCVATFATVADYIRHDQKRGITTDIMLLFTMVLGALAITSPALAASLAVLAAILLSAKQPIHGFVLGVLTQEEMNDFLILAGSTLIILPLMPHRNLGPFDAINPYNLWLVVILIMAIGAFGHFALRLLGSRIALPFVGLVSGFISSLATISEMGRITRLTPSLMPAALAGSVLSCFSTVIQVGLIALTFNPATFERLIPILLLSGMTILLTGSLLTFREMRHLVTDSKAIEQSFSIKTALVLVGLIGLVLMVSTALNSWFGASGVLLVSGVAGLVDAHAPTMSIASLVSTHQLSVNDSTLPILIALTMNTLSKIGVAATSGGRGFAIRLAPSLLLQIAAIWIAWFII
jgi:uncharacterized membrane protein (DUF4010 family)